MVTEVGLLASVGQAIVVGKEGMRRLRTMSRMSKMRMMRMTMRMGLSTRMRMWVRGIILISIETSFGNHYCTDYRDQKKYGNDFERQHVFGEK